MRTLLFLVVGGLLSWSCTTEKTRHLFSKGAPLGHVERRLVEASGLVASIGNPGLLWTVNDDGKPEVFLIDQQASTRLVCTLAHIRNRDWEDIAIGAGPDSTKNYVYVADIGDNEAQYEYKFIYRFEEPQLAAEKAITITQFDTLILRMPDGKRDSETILIDHFTSDLFLITKREESVGLYTTPYPFAHDTLTLRKVMTLPFSKIVAGSISSDGQEVLLKNYNNVYYWKGTNGESFAQLLEKKPIELPYEREPQGEGIAWSRDGSEFYTLSEGTKKRPADLFVYKRKK